MRIFKPQSLGLLHKPYRHQGSDRLVVAALGFFRLGEPAERFLTENLQWPDVLKALPQGMPLDEVMPKPRAEFLLAAKAFAPGGVPVAQMEVEASVGALSKRLTVHGDRRWRYGMLPWHVVDEPLPFDVMPIRYERAYGGEKHPGNPVGVGHTGSRLGAFVGSNQGAMPNIAYPGEVLDDHHRQHAPAGFLPLDIRWQPRAGRIGTYDRQWLENDFPGLASDLDWAAFSSAPADQRFAGFLRGGEPYRLAGMHPQQALIEGTLPDMRMRAFLLRKGDAPADCEEVGLRLDTVWLFPEYKLGVVVHRGQADIADSEAEDIEALMIGYEHNRDVARSLSHYREVLALRMDPDTCLLHALNDAQLTPQLGAAEQQARDREQAEAEAEHLARQQAQLDELMDDFRAQTGIELPAGHEPPKAQLPPLGVVPKAAIARGDVDLSAIMAKAQALVDEAERKHEQGMAQLEAARKERLKPVVSPEDIKPDPDEQIEQADRNAAEQCVGTPAQPDPADEAKLRAITKRLAGGDITLSDDERRVLADSQARLPHLARQGRRSSPKAVPDAPAPEVGRHLRQRVGDWLAAGESLAGRDLCGANLAGMDLSGADLRDVMLEHADLRAACLAGAQLSGAVFTAAQLEGTDFSGADLSGANLSGCHAAGARFVQARLDKLLAMDGDFDGADLGGVSLCNATLQDIRLKGARLDGAILKQTLLLGVDGAGSSWRDAAAELSMINVAQLERADLSGIRLDSCVLLQLQAPDSKWRGARLQRVFAGGALLGRADLREVRASHAGWRDAELSGADLSGGGFLDCDFGGANLTAGRLLDGVFSRSLFIRADLADSDARRADFYQALMRKADLSRADLRDANLVQANLFEVVLDDADLRGARPSPLGRAA